MALFNVDKCLKESLSENLSQILFACSGRSSVIHTTSDGGGRDVRRIPSINIGSQQSKEQIYLPDATGSSVTDGVSSSDRSKSNTFTNGSSGDSRKSVSRKASVTFPMMNPFMSVSSNLSTGYQISYLNSTVVTTMLILPSVDSFLDNGDGFSVGRTEGVNEGRLDGEAVGYKVRSK